MGGVRSANKQRVFLALDQSGNCNFHMKVFQIRLTNTSLLSASQITEISDLLVPEMFPSKGIKTLYPRVVYNSFSKFSGS